MECDRLLPAATEDDLSQVRFTWRNHDPMPALSTFDRMAVREYSWSELGGPKFAMLTSPWDGTHDYFSLLRCGVEIFNDIGEPVWWGVVRQIRIPHGAGSLVYSLDRLYNRVLVTYAMVDEGDPDPVERVITSFAEDARSIAEFGNFEIRIPMRHATTTAAENRRDVLLALFKDPSLTPDEMSVEGVEVECCGWFDLLAKHYYTNNGGDLVEITTQISAVITDFDQFIMGVNIEDVSGILISESRDGDDTSLQVIQDLLQIGATDGQMLTATVRQDRVLEISKRQALASPEYYFNQEGNLETLGGALVEPEKCVVNVWSGIKDVPSILGGASSLTPRYITEASYDAESRKTTYRWNDIASVFKLFEVGK